jgi:Ca-activated chloride channel family protein
MKSLAAAGYLATILLGWCAAQGAQPPALSAAADSLPPSSTTSIKVDVNLVPVEVSVRDERGHAVGDLQRDDFRVFEDGKEQELKVFAHEELPLAVALVIDNSSSIVASLRELRRGALDTLALLKPEDKVAIFSFGEKPELVEGLTSNHQALAVDLWALSPYGGSSINDGLYAAAEYLGRAAPDRRRAIILLSDNEPSDEQTVDPAQVERAALQSATPIYSVRVGYLTHSRGFFLSHPEARLHEVQKICHATGGELIDTNNGTSISAAMAAVIAWLKQGYTLGYSPTNRVQDGSYRSIEVQLRNHEVARDRKYTIYARAGYYARLNP